MEMHYDDLKSDKFSALPSSLIVDILLRLPLNEAVRTSILSRNWRCNWKRIPELIFDRTIYEKSTGSMLWSKDELMFSMYEVVFLHQAPILKFELYIPELEGCRQIDKIIQFLSLHGVEVFKLGIGCDQNQKYRLPSFLYSCLQLKKLSLSWCTLNPPAWFCGFRKLIKLDLTDVIYADGALSTFISSCPQLKWLSLCFDKYSCLEIDALNLAHLKICGQSRRVGSISLKNVPQLISLIITSKLAEDEKLMQYCADNFIRSLASVKTLRINDATLKCLAAGLKERTTTTTMLRCLELLDLMDISSRNRDDIFSALWLIRHSPNLESICLGVYYEDDDDDDDDEDDVADNREFCELVKALDFPNMSLDQLSVVHMDCLFSHKSELEFISLLLAKSPNLKKVFIAPCDDPDGQGKQFMLKKISELQDASAGAEIKYLEF